MKTIRERLKKFVGKAVIIKWNIAVTDADWICFRVEKVNKGTVSLSGMTDDEGNVHDGSWVRVPLSDIEAVWRRW